ncbi:hypothetical protein DQ04_10301030 [Trypanosoma grayi]|uniref:hypothetical protein n=1 Tax=Trypanosoma grayi TaxID=71804 RepID=UPI0004F3F459|nr:hypothetical protein DQ04_10301030 [Trypanosoma grayi]KEG07285.1 hypothetical protein DQ04_10301030 [Trypanosoma grayi]
MEQTKSESVFEDDNTFCDTDTAVSTSDHGLEAEPRLPLTKEMLELIPNGVIIGPRAPHTVDTSHMHANDGTVSAAGSESLFGGAEREEEAAPAERLWNGRREMKRGGSTTMSTGLPTSYQRGQQSGYSDEETTQHAFNCATNRTDLSSSTATSVISLDSATPSGIMACRGWVRRRMQGTPTGSQSRSMNARTDSFSAIATTLDEQLHNEDMSSPQARRRSTASH